MCGGDDCWLLELVAACFCCNLNYTDHIVGIMAANWSRAADIWVVGGEDGNVVITGPERIRVS